MTGWLQLTQEQRKITIDQAAIRSGILAKAIEKDWWVTLVLKALFTSPLAQHFIFKGGTSLSKGWKLIDRFSEDIDISLDPVAFNRQYKLKPSPSYVRTLKQEGSKFTTVEVKKHLENQLSVLGVLPGTISVVAAPVMPLQSAPDPTTLYVRYPSLYPPNPYIADEVKIEFSVRSLKDPYSIVPILSILSEYVPNESYPETPFNVMAVEPHKTFLEKIFLLHEKFFTHQVGNIPVERQSRHLYDLVRMMGTPIEKDALESKELYRLLIEHRNSYIMLKNMDYGTLQYSSLTFLPPNDLNEHFRSDYRSMQDQMIYGDSPDFDTLIQLLKILRGRFRMVGERRTLEEVIEVAMSISEKAPQSIMDEMVTIPAPYVGPGGTTVIYHVTFQQTKKGLVFENIHITRS